MLTLARLWNPSQRPASRTRRTRSCRLWCSVMLGIPLVTGCASSPATVAELEEETPTAQVASAATDEKADSGWPNPFRAMKRLLSRDEYTPLTDEEMKTAAALPESVEPRKTLRVTRRSDSLRPEIERRIGSRRPTSSVSAPQIARRSPASAVRPATANDFPRNPFEPMTSDDDPALDDSGSVAAAEQLVRDAEAKRAEALRSQKRLTRSALSQPRVTDEELAAAQYAAAQRARRAAAAEASSGAGQNDIPDWGSLTAESESPVQPVAANAARRDPIDWAAGESAQEPANPWETHTPLTRQQLASRTPGSQSAFAEPADSDARATSDDTEPLVAAETGTQSSQLPTIIPATPPSDIPNPGSGPRPIPIVEILPKPPHVSASGAERSAEVANASRSQSQASVETPAEPPAFTDDFDAAMAAAEQLAADRLLAIERARAQQVARTRIKIQAAAYVADRAGDAAASGVGGTESSAVKRALHEEDPETVDADALCRALFEGEAYEWREPETLQGVPTNTPKVRMRWYDPSVEE